MYQNQLNVKTYQLILFHKIVNYLDGRWRLYGLVQTK